MQLRFSTLPPASPVYPYAQYAASTAQPLPFAPGALAYQFPAEKVAHNLERDLDLSSETDSSALRAEAIKVSGYQNQKNAQDGFILFWNSVSEELEQAWRSIRIMFR
ncbi:hypothetical protein H8B13_06330 [Hymenobacter sp. BT188]|uniref:hypothetical protein n=1 Tax=Hymenobacter sp. BT188 TaxID=2763504 RepID=UPI001651729B|nr:hypothetical protein [Hymenobacter sp. BT188]MBC6606427.1 hypothetical protein [Hymenobacter sp. BT188]